MSEDKKTVVKMAYIYSQEGRWDKAVTEYKKLIKLDPEDFNAQNMLGDVFVKKGDVQPAYDSYMVAAEAYNRLGQMEKATVVYRKISKLDASQLNPAAKKKQAVFQKQVEGESAMEANELDKAAEAFKAVLQLDPERFDVYQKLGDLYIRKGQSDLAVKQYNEIADIYFKNKLYKKAAPVYKKIVELDPTNVEAHAAMGEIHARSGNESEAKKEYLLIAEAMLTKGDLETALVYSKKAVALKSIEAYYYLGQVFLLQQKFDDAKGEFEKLLKFKLNHVGALVSMGKIFEAKGQPDEAQKHYQRALKVEKNSLEALVAAGDLHAKKGEKAQAAAMFSEASAAAAAMNNAEKAAEYGTKAVELEPSSANAALAPAAQPAPAAPAPVTVAEVAPAPALLEEEIPAAKVVAAPQAAPMAAPAPAPVLVPEAESPAMDPDEERMTLMNMAENYVAEESFDEAIELYQRILSNHPQDKAAKDALTRVYSLVAKGAMGSVPAAAPAPAPVPAPVPVAPAAPKADEAAAKKAAEAAAKKAEEESAKRAASEAATRLDQLKKQAEDEQRKLDEMRKFQEEERRKFEEESRMKREAEEARQRAEAEAEHKRAEEVRRKLSEAEMRKNLEAEIRKQLEEEIRRKAEEEIRLKTEIEMSRRLEDERRKAEAEGSRRAEEEIRRRMDEERKKFDAEKTEVRRRMEEETRKAIEAQERARSEREALEKVDTIRKKEEEESKLKIQKEVLQRVQSQQKEKQAVYQKHIDEIRRKVEEANAAPGSPAAQPAAAKAGSGPADAHDEMDDFMTETFADIYTKQGLTAEAVRIYEKILSREPDNAAVRKKLDVLQGKAPAAAAPEAAAAPKPEADPKKKSKVSYL